MDILVLTFDPSVTVSSQGDFHKASEIVQVTKKRYPPSSQNAPVWKLCEQLLLFDQAVHHGDWTAADQAVVNMASANSSEATYRSVAVEHSYELISAISTIKNDFPH